MTTAEQGTALITGASSGIGATFARHLAHQGYALILVARRLDRLQALADELKQCFSVCTEALEADLSNSVDLERVERRISEHDDLTMLINNAGFGTVGSFVEVPLARHLKMIQVHVTATTRLCYAALPGMIQRKQGAIINVSSLMALMPVGIYSATKAYLNTFSEALQVELKGTAIHIQALCPGLTHTEFHDLPEFQTDRSKTQMAPQFLWMSADEVVTTSLQALGQGSVICTPGWGNRLMAALMRSALAPLMIKAMSQHESESKQHESPVTR
jgi:short-subunit dehydrogenase